MKTYLLVAAAAVILLLMALSFSPSSECPLKGTPACPEYPACCAK